MAQHLDVASGTCDEEGLQGSPLSSGEDEHVSDEGQETNALEALFVPSQPTAAAGDPVYALTREHVPNWPMEISGKSKLRNKKVRG